jgi:hypothetical protein
MEPEPDRIDLSPLDPGDWQRKAAALAARAHEHRLRRAVVVRRLPAVALSAAASLVLWFFAPSPERAPPTAWSSTEMLDWAIHTTDPTEALRYAQ